MALTNHILPDSPTNNFATLNPLLGATLTFSNGNLNVSGSGSTTTGTIAFPTSGTYYYEATISEVSEGYPVIGIVSITTNTTGYLHSKQAAIRPVNANGDRPEWVIDGVDREYDQISSTALAANDIIQVIYDADNGKVWFGINNTYYGVSSGSSTTVSASDIANGINPAYVIDTNYTYIPMVNTHSTSEVAKFNFGQDPFFGGAKSPSTTYTDANGIGAFYYDPTAIDSEALALCTANLPEMTPNVAGDVPQDYFKAVIWTGDGNYPRSISTDFAPDLIWTKARTITPTNNQDSDHLFMDSVRGDGNLKWISPSYGGAEGVYYDNANADLTSSGFTIQSTPGTNCLNDNNAKFVAWCWKAGGNSNTFNINGTGYSTYSALQTDNTSLPAITSGMITPSGMSINTDAGFSIVKWQASNGSDKTVPHGLSNSLDMIVIKNLDTGTYGWHTSHIGLTTNHNLLLNEPDQSWNPFTGGWVEVGTGGVFNIKNGTNGTNVNNGTDNYIAYCWHSVENYSKCGSYTGNGSPDGPFVYCGFRPAFVMLKITTNATNWYIVDNKRPAPYNVVVGHLYPDSSNVESTYSGGAIDLLSNGFKIRGNPIWDVTNQSNDTYIFMAFAEQPFKFSNAR